MNFCTVASLQNYSHSGVLGVDAVVCHGCGVWGYSSVMLQIVVEAAGTVCDADCSISQTGIDGGLAVGRALTRFRPLVRCRPRPIATLQCVLHLFILLCSSTAHLCSTCVARALDRPATHTATRSEQHGLTYLQACSTTSSCATQYIGWSDVTESVATIRSPFCGYNTTDIMRWVKWRRFIVLFK